MRITGGLARGIRLETGKRSDVRPATDMMRQALFSSLGDEVSGRKCLDLFAGTGAYGLEAFSRGASSVRFVERDRDGVRAISDNLHAVCRSMGVASGGCAVEARDVFVWRAEAVFDLVFADPPYEMLPVRGREVFDVVEGVLKADGLFIFEMPGGLELTHPGFELRKRLGKGRGNDPSVCIYCVQGS